MANMRIILALLVGMFFRVISPFSAEQAPFQAPADAAWHSYQNLRFDPNRLPEFSNDEITHEWLNMNYVARAAAAQRFYTRFPDDSRHWQAALDYVNLVLTFISDASDAEKTKAQQIRSHLKTNSFAPENIRARIWAVDSGKDLQSSLGKGDFSEARKIIDAFAIRFPEAEQRIGQEQNYLNALAGSNLISAKAWASSLLSDRSPKIVAMAQAWQRKWEIEQHPMEMKFTAFDGREVDLKKWRGKVVIVDFWATWCTPCLAELPNLKACFEKYHSQGLEVVGIALDSESAKKKLQDLIQKKQLAWPQHFDGKHMHNEWAEKFAVSSIPSVWLLNKAGVVVSKDARGPQLEAMIQTELKKPDRESIEYRTPPNGK